MLTNTSSFIFVSIFLYLSVKFSVYSKIISIFYSFYPNFRNGISVLDPLNVLYGINCWIKFDTDPNHSRFLFFLEKIEFTEFIICPHKCSNFCLWMLKILYLIRKYINTYIYFFFKEEKYSSFFKKKNSPKYFPNNFLNIKKQKSQLRDMKSVKKTASINSYIALTNSNINPVMFHHESSFSDINQ